VVDDEVIDDVIVARVPTEGPHAFDISAHGGVRVIERILEALDQYGAPLCDSGGSRPLIWPAATLIEQEVIEGLSQAKTSRAVRFLAWQRRHLESHLRETAHFCRQDADKAKEPLQRLVTGYRAARYLVEGATVTIVGPPNSGKSTLFNHLVGRSAAIVSTQAGTTRDWVTASVEINGVPVILVDTAGRREPAADAEHRAIERGWTKAAQADLCLLLLDGSKPPSAEAIGASVRARSLACYLTVVNKVDLGLAWKTFALPLCGDKMDVAARVSARTGMGLDLLTGIVLNSLGFESWDDAAPALFTARQVETTKRVLSDLPHDPGAAEAILTGELIGCKTDQLGPG
jgi:small GTP-binding protein